MTPRCPYEVCDGSGFVVDEETNTARPCRCRPQRIGRARARSLSAVIPRRFQGVSFERSPVADMDPSVVRDVRRFVDDIDANLEQGRGLWFMGDVGTGKTTLAMLVSKTALDAGRSVAIYSLPRLLAEIRKTFEERSEQSYLELLDRLAAVDLLHIDDLGAERTSEWVLEQLYSIINARYEDRRSLVVTTNLGHEELREQIMPRTVSRLVEMCGDPLPLYGHDRRMEVRSA
ncbi:MAG TPA: ATP-binding protein [Solirubrobacteraceae bacterium]|jgi:DNA replication protein DnaC|nr:ATP-binding protein [Solirubrobacteraceae bacterium]